MTVELETRVQHLEDRQDNADERFEIILKELGDAKKERTEMYQMLRLLLEDAGIPVPQKEKA